LTDKDFLEEISTLARNRKNKENRGSAVFSDCFFRDEFQHLVKVYREKNKKGLIKNEYVYVYISDK